MARQQKWLIVFLCAASLAAPLFAGKEGVIQCANLIYGGTHTSRCFSDEFLSAVQKQTTIPTERRFKSVKLADDELFKYPFVIMTGESSFYFTSKERKNLKKYLAKGGFLLASAGCSNKKWDHSFRREMRTLFGKKPLNKVKMTHPIFSTVKEIKKLVLSHGTDAPRLESIERHGKIIVIYSPHGLNDTAHTEGCCCCGGNEIANALEVVVNIFVYALLH